MKCNIPVTITTSTTLKSPQAMSQKRRNLRKNGVYWRFFLVVSGTYSDFFYITIDASKIFQHSWSLQLNRALYA